jgi:hypothetical protein
VWVLVGRGTRRVTEVIDTRPGGADLRRKRRAGRVFLDSSGSHRGEREDIPAYRYGKAQG